MKKSRFIRKASGFISLVIFWTLSCHSEQFEGYFQHHVGELRYNLISLFVPYNPVVLVPYPKEHTKQQFFLNWPLGTFVSCDSEDFNEKASSINFIWIDSDDELSILIRNQNLLGHVDTIYTTTHFLDFAIVRSFLEGHKFSLLSHWPTESGYGSAIFLKKEIFDATMKSLNFTPSFTEASNFLYLPNVETGLKQVDFKPYHHSFDKIDFIYMINLDERPEKFAHSSLELAGYNIVPYRFSAVNGWKLSNDVLQEVGVKYFTGMSQGQYRATSYVDVEGREYVSNEYMQQDGKTYFALGMSRGAIGIVLSHLSVLQDAYDSKYSTIWVMEDDIHVIEDPHQIASLIAELDQIDPTWDVLFTDVDTKNAHGEKVPCRSLAMRPNFNIQPLSTYLDRFYPVSTNISRIGMRYGTYSMVISRSGITKILRYFKKYGVFLPYDMDFWLNPELKMYSPKKDIVSTLPNALSDNGKPSY